MNPESGSSTVIEFGRIAVLPLRRELRVDGESVELGARAFDVLMALVEAGGRVLAKDELMARVWPDRVVEENNLQVQIAALRKALADERELVRTVAGRGYQFTGTVRTRTPASANNTVPTAALTNLPEAVSELIGRDAELREILGLAAERRLVTLTGAGGVGKTRLGVEAARRMQAKFPDGVWIAELGALTDPKLVPITVAAGLGLTFATGILSPERVATALDSKRFLLVLDNCEHVIDAAASMAEAFLRASQVACVLATSREPLRAEGESLYRVPSLDVPAEEIVDREQLLKSSAVKLFLARTRAAAAQLSTDARIAAMAAICRRLDGIPLAIELAAARAAALGIEGLAARLDDRFRLLTGGHRTALPRHQTLRATLDWSYELLPATERVILRRLSVFSGSFTLESAGAVVSGGEIAESDVIDYVANLVAKSLVTADVNRATALYRLLDTMRAYALEKLGESGEFDALARRHAEHLRDVFERAETEWQTQPTAEWLAAYGRHTDNVRAALDWAFSPCGDAEIGAALSASAVPLWFQLSLIDECRRRVQQALAAVRPAAGAGTRRDMQLFAALATALLYTKGPGQEVNAAWTNVLRIAESLDDIDYRLRALWGLWASRVNSGEPRPALELALAFVSHAASKADPADSLVGDRMTGLALHLLGNQTSARQHTERMLSRYVTAVHQSDLVRFQFDQRVMARTTLGQILWLQGFPDQAMRTAQEAVDDAQAIDHATSLCNSLAHTACRVALLNGDLTAAEHFVGMLIGHSERHALAFWQIWGRCFKGVLLIKRDEVATGLQHLRVALAELRVTGLGLPHTAAFLGDLAEGLGRAGEIAQGLAAIDEAIESSQRNGELWCMADSLRIKGDLLLQENSANACEGAENHFRQCLDWARKQRVLSWELRGAMSLARLRKLQGQPGDARELLAAVYGRFTEGFATADLKSAKSLLDSLL
jgi:predicted ATPase/DNA-binding winged helix-turn-helix (wHTH) protein